MTNTAAKCSIRGRSRLARRGARVIASKAYGFASSTTATPIFDCVVAKSKRSANRDTECDLGSALPNTVRRSAKAGGGRLQTAQFPALAVPGFLIHSIALRKTASGVSL